MPATSRSGTALGAPVGQRPGRLAFEIDEADISARHQYLPEVQITVDARAE